MAIESHHVLIVDDEPQVRELTGRALSEHGFRCDLASDGEEALRMASSTAYQAVVTDLRMPKRHGHALCRELLALPAPPCVVVCTALADARLTRDLLGRGVHEVVHKPVVYEVLAMKVRSMLDQRTFRPAVPPQPGKPAKQGKPKKANLMFKIESSLVELTEILGERLDTVFEAERELPEPPRAVRDYIRRLSENEVVKGGADQSIVLPGHEQRVSDRVTCYTTAIAAPVDCEGKRVGDPFKLALRDLSEGGARLLYTRATNAKFLALCWNATQLVAKQIRVIAQVRRCEPCGPFYDIGVQFAMVD